MMKLQRVLPLIVLSVALLTLSANAVEKHNPPQPLPCAYPDEWEIPFIPSQPLPPHYEGFGHTTFIYPADTVSPPFARALPCDIQRERDIPVTLRDGTEIYTDVLLPADNTEKLPAIIAWSPYGKQIPPYLPGAPIVMGFPTVPLEWHSGFQKWEGPDAAFWVCNGYAVVHPDASGTFKSEGDIMFWGSVEAGDGHDVIEWVAKQPWSSGNVGMAGNSWLAVSQWGIAATNPPSLKAFAPWTGFNDVFRNVFMWGGVADVGFIGGYPHYALFGEHTTEDIGAAFQQNPLLPSPYWEDKRAPVEKIKAPAYVGADMGNVLHQAGTLDAWRRLGSKQKWLRTNRTNLWYDHYTPENEQDLKRFFDHFLKGENNGWEKTPRVRISIMDPNEETIDNGTTNTPFRDFPVPRTHYRKLFLNAAKGSLSKWPVRKPATASYDAQTGSTSFTIRFHKDTQLIGYPKARLYVEAQGNDDMDLFLLVEKLSKDGTPLPLIPANVNIDGGLVPSGAAGRLRVSLRELDRKKSTRFNPVYALTTPRKLSAGEIVPVDVAILAMATRWHAGEQLRLTVGGYYDAPGASPVPTINAGEHFIHTGGKCQSYLQVPMVPWSNRDR